MSTTVWIALGAAALLAIVWRSLLPSLDRRVDRAVLRQDPAPLIAAIVGTRQGARPDAFNHAIRQLWDRYERALAMPLIRALAEHHPEAKIAQFWLGQAHSVEPELARQFFDAPFLQEHFRPEVAATCGEVG